MSNRVIRQLSAAMLLLAPLAYSANIQAQTSPPPIEAFGHLPSFSSPEISPDGKYIAAIQALNGHPATVIYPVGAPDAKPAVLAGGDWIIESLEWVKSDRLAIVMKRGIVDPDDGRVHTWMREVTVSPTGADPVLLNHNQQSLQYNYENAGVVDRDLDDPDISFIPLSVADLDGYFRYNLLAVNVRSGQSHTAMVGNHNTTQWFMDGHGHVVARVDQSKDPLVDHLKFYDGKDWHDAGDFDASGDKGTGLEGLTEEGRPAFVGQDARHMKALFGQLSPTSDKVSVLFSNPNYDLDDVLTDEWTGRVVGVSYADDRMRYQFFDPKLEALQNGLEKAFPNLSVQAASTDLTRQHVIVAVDGPQQPPAYYLLDRTTHKAEPLASTYPELDGVPLGDEKPYPYKSSDGLDIHAYLTLPPASAGKQLPLVVMPHGGPEERDMLSFDWQAQFFASRGYAVFQPNFSGSSGYGHKFIEAGMGQWGLRMQDDVTDGVRKLIADGIVDPKRICIVGGSYGGYAALAGATFTPDLYACAVSFAGVSDLPRMLRSERSDYGTYSETVSYWLSRLGEDTDKLAAVSPARHADQVHCPILLLHGENDTTVRIRQSELMYDALKDAGKDVQFIRIPGEDHYFSFADTRVRFLTEVEKFLAAHIGPGNKVTASKS